MTAPEILIDNFPQADEKSLWTTEDSLIGATPAHVEQRVHRVDWNFAEAPSDEFSHALHPYPAKFAPQVPRQLVAMLSAPGELVLDPFSGGGTTAVEALAAGRRYCGIDANPVATAIARAKTTRLDRDDLVVLHQLEARLLASQQVDLEGSPSWLPTIPNLSKWYAPHVFSALGLVREWIQAVPRDAARNLAMVSFLQAASRLSFQDSETRYASKPRDIDVLEVPRTVLAALRRIIRIATEVPMTTAGDHVRLITGDAREVGAFGIEPKTAGLVVTSPPYPNSYDYHLYHRFRLFWLGANPGDLRRVEIGSHLTNQSRQTPIEDYLRDIESVLTNCRDALAPERYAVLVVGDGVFEGTTFRTCEHVASVADRIGFQHITTVTRTLPVHRRSMTKPGRRLVNEEIVFLRCRPVAKRGLVVQPNYTLFEYERLLQIRELKALGADPVREKDGIEVNSIGSLPDAAFTHGVDLNGITMPTRQFFAEGEPGSKLRRKHSTYASHGVHRYKGKFYPQLAKCLINLSGVCSNSFVLDPFGGSGTVAVEAILNGLNAVTVDCNPLATAIARAKTQVLAIPRRDIELAFRRLEELLSNRVSATRELTEFDDSVLPELKRWFPSPVLAKLDYLLQIVREEANAELVGFLEVLISDLVREISQQEPRDLRIRRRAIPIKDAPVFECFATRLSTAQRKLEQVWGTSESRPKLGSADVLLASSEDPSVLAQIGPRAIDAIVSSPPYAAALPYLDTDRLSLAAIFGLDSTKRKTLESSMIGSREIAARERLEYEATLEREIKELPRTTQRFLRAYQSAVTEDGSAGFRRRQAPAVLLRYFLMMGRVLGNLRSHVERGTPCWLVLGDSQSTVGGKKWVIPTVDEVASIAQLHNFALLERIPITVTREDVIHSRNTITRNEILRFRAA